MLWVNLGLISLTLALAFGLVTVWRPQVAPVGRVMLDTWATRVDSKDAGVGTSSLGVGAKIYIHGPGFDGYTGTGAATVYTVPGTYRVDAYFYNGDLGREATGTLYQCSYVPLSG